MWLPVFLRLHVRKDNQISPQKLRCALSVSAWVITVTRWSLEFPKRNWTWTSTFGESWSSLTWTRSSAESLWVRRPLLWRMENMTHPPPANNNKRITHSFLSEPTSRFDCYNFNWVQFIHLSFLVSSSEPPKQSFQLACNAMSKCRGLQIYTKYSLCSQIIHF